VSFTNRPDGGFSVSAVLPDRERTEGLYSLTERAAS
jgi:hypothetical protein